MKSLLLNLDNGLEKSLYIQIYDGLKSGIIDGSIPEGSKLPSLRKFAEENEISVTTVEAAYNQLLVEGYVESRPKSGYYVSENITDAALAIKSNESIDSLDSLLPQDNEVKTEGKTEGKTKTLIYDEDSFDFSKWKKMMNKVFSEYAHLLQVEADVQGESALRYEIAKYLFSARGVKCSPEQVIIGAGSQQLTAHLIRILREIGVSHAATEMPGYGPIRDIFKEEGFSMSAIPVDSNGISVETLPNNARSVVYVSPSNQFPTGAVMPVARRYELIKWAEENDSYIFEDDYDSELRYFGKPVPALQGLDSNGRVIYLGSFSSTLFDALKISYMVLPKELVAVFNTIKDKYSQTCSKAEQICLALYMENGYYYRNIKKCRKSYAAKLDITMDMFEKNGAGIIEAVNSKSGMAVMLNINTSLPAEEICKIGRDIGLLMSPVVDLCSSDKKVIYFYFYRVPNSLLTLLIKMFVQKVKSHLQIK